MHKLDLCYVYRANSSARNYIERTNRVSLNFQDDPERAIRIRERKCIVCFYVPERLVAGIFYDCCKICETKILSYTSGGYLICDPCAKEHNLCKQCCAHMEFKSIRKLKFIDENDGS